MEIYRFKSFKDCWKYKKKFPYKYKIPNDLISSNIEKLKLDYLKSLEPIATRKCSEKFLEIVSKFQTL